jgi:hypothetical protein
MVPMFAVTVCLLQHRLELIGQKAIKGSELPPQTSEDPLPPVR